LFVSPAWAGGGFSLFGSYGEITKEDRSIGAGARLSLGGESLVFDLTATYLPQQSTTIFREGGAPVSDDLRITPLEIGGRYIFSAGSDFRLYLGLGGSYFLVDLGGGNSDNEFGFYGLGGFVFGANANLQFFAEVLYRQTEITVDYGHLGRADVDVGGLGLNAGLTFRF
jgi:hypothetical protein